MLNYDFSPFYRSTIGFDRLLALLDKTAGLEASAPSYPPYNIERTGENAYRITLAVAGFADSELSVESREGVLTVRGAKSAHEKDEKRETLYWYDDGKGTMGKGFFAQQFIHVGQWGTHCDPPAHFVRGN